MQIVFVNDKTRKSKLEFHGSLHKTAPNVFRCVENDLMNFFVEIVELKIRKFKEGSDKSQFSLTVGSSTIIEK